MAVVTCPLEIPPHPNPLPLGARGLIQHILKFPVQFRQGRTKQKGPTHKGQSLAFACGQQSSAQFNYLPLTLILSKDTLPLPDTIQARDGFSQVSTGKCQQIIRKNTCWFWINSSFLE